MSKILRHHGPHSHLKRTFKQIGLVLHPFSDEFNARVIIGVQRCALSRGYEVVFTYTEADFAQQQHNIRSLLHTNVDGLIILPVGDSAEHEVFVGLQSANTPMVLIDWHYATLDTDRVSCDNQEGTYRATEHLLILGHRKIGLIESSNSNTRQQATSQERRVGYRQALEHYGLNYDPTLVFACPNHSSNNFDYSALLSIRNRPTAFLAANDLQAAMLITAAQRCGLRVPDDIAIVGYDDLRFAPYLMPSLTTVSQPFLEVGYQAATILLNRIEGMYMPLQHIKLPTQLVVRESCGIRLAV